MDVPELYLGGGRGRREAGGQDHSQPGPACGELKRECSQGYCGCVVYLGIFSRLLVQIT